MKIYYPPKAVFICLIPILFSCHSSPLKKRYNQELFISDLQEIKKSGKITNNEHKILSEYIFGYTFEERDLNGKSYKEILHEARKKKQEEKENIEKVKREETERLAGMQQILNISVSSKEFEKSKWEDFLKFKIHLQNQSDKDIQKLKYSFTVYNQTGKELKECFFTYDERLPAKATQEITRYWNFSEFTSGDPEIRDTPSGNLIFQFTPLQIIFTDGTSLVHSY
jgi:hypothetical protein